MQQLSDQEKQLHLSSRLLNWRKKRVCALRQKIEEKKFTNSCYAPLLAV